MNREIKFRAWDKEKKIMLGSSRYNHYQLHLDLNGEIWRGGVNWTKRYILLQYTGLKDKKGVEIFEGDKLAYSNGCVGKVSFEDGCFLGSRTIDGLKIPLAEFVSKDLEIIGNKYENSNLLK